MGKKAVPSAIVYGWEAVWAGSRLRVRAPDEVSCMLMCAGLFVTTGQRMGGLDVLDDQRWVAGCPREDICIALGIGPVTAWFWTATTDGFDLLVIGVPAFGPNHEVVH